MVNTSIPLNITCNRKMPIMTQMTYMMHVMTPIEGRIFEDVIANQWFTKN